MEKKINWWHTLVCGVWFVAAIWAGVVSRTEQNAAFGDDVRSVAEQQVLLTNAIYWLLTAGFCFMVGAWFLWRRPIFEMRGTIDKSGRGSLKDRVKSARLGI